MQLSCKLHKEDKRSSIQYVAAGCEPYTASETFRMLFVHMTTPCSYGT